MAMYLERVKNRNSPPAILVRESYRKDGDVKKRTVANLSRLPEAAISAVEAALKNGGTLQGNDFDIEQSFPHGHVAAVLGTLKKLGLDKMISSTRSRQRDLVVAMIVARVIDPESKLATAQGLHEENAQSSLPKLLEVTGATAEDLYAAMDWLSQRQKKIEKKLAKKHLHEGDVALYDASSTWYDGNCDLAAHGYSRDRKRGKKQINFGLLCNAGGCPLSIDVFKGNTADPQTLKPQIAKLKEDYALRRVILTGDRGMITHKAIREDLQQADVDWISALNAPTIKGLANDGDIHPELFDDRHMAEIASTDFPGERLIVCKNPYLAEERSRNREDLLQCTEAKLQEIQDATKRDKRPLRGADKIGVRVGRVLDKYKMGKHFHYEITDDSFTFSRKQEQIRAEAALDGIYVIRTSVESHEMSAEETVSAYKSLSRAERAFRSMKTVDLEIHPIRHRLNHRVRAHIFLCMLAYYVQYHMRQALAPILFDDTDKEIAESGRVSPVAPAEKSPSAKAKAAAKYNEDGIVVQSFQSLLKSLGSISKHTVRMKQKGASAFTKITNPTKTQEKAFQLLGINPL